MSAQAPVNRILRSSIVDGPGNRAAVFVQGCNFNCVYCHNPETISLCTACGECLKVCPVGALSRRSGDEADDVVAPGIQWQQESCVFCDACLKACPHNASPRVRILSPEAVMAEIEPSLPFIRGLTVSGGECTRYPDFLRGLGDLAHRMSRTFFLDSNGSYDFAGDPALMEAVDSVMLDIKADPENLAEYRRVTGCGEEHLLAQTEFLARAGKLWEIRTVVSPGLFDAVKVVDRMCRFLAGLKLPEPRPQYKLIRYRSMGVRKEAAALLQAPGEELMAKLAGICAGYGVQAVIV